MQVYNRIRDLREDADLTQEKLVTKLDMHKTTYTNYEQGKHTVPLDFAVTLSRFYNVSIDYIAGLTNIKHNTSANNLSPFEMEIITKLRKLDDIDKGRILSTIDTIISDRNNAKKMRDNMTHD
ncbi:MAG: helix-turn-helix transcriptional regulator [Oscillospiraceae bacterium]|nr:helix-turn-helix transcriptional regulator [Oscillospiraceae bacterium]